MVYAEPPDIYSRHRCSRYRLVDSGRINDFMSVLFLFLLADN